MFSFIGKLQWSGLIGLQIRNLIRSAIRLDLRSGTLRPFLIFPWIAFIYGANCMISPKMLPNVSIIPYFAKYFRINT